MSQDPMGYFRSRLEPSAWPCRGDADPRPVVGTFCNFVPDEVVLAMGARLVRLDSGDHAAAERAEAELPRDACPVARASVGTLPELAAEGALPDLIVIPAPCDAKRKLGARLGQDVPVHVLAVPADKTADRAAERWAEEIGGLVRALASLTGKRLERRAFRAACELVNARQQAFRGLLALQRTSPPRVKGSEVLAIAAASFVDAPELFTEHLLAFVKERGARDPEVDAGCRVLLTGAPVIPPNDRLVRILEGANLHVVADDLCSGTERLYHPVVPREWSVPEMLLAAAERTLLPCTCPCFSSHQDRVERILGLLDETGAQGVVHHTLRACVLFQFETSAIRDAVRARGAPTLELHTDYTDQDSEQLRTRVEAFAEMLRSRR